MNDDDNIYPFADYLKDEIDSTISTDYDNLRIMWAGYCDDYIKFCKEEGYIAEEGWV